MHKSCAACGAACERTSAKFTIIYACVKRVSNITKREGGYAALCCVQCGAVLTSSASCWPSSTSCAATTPVALCNLQRALIVFNQEGGCNAAPCLSGAVLCLPVTTSVDGRAPRALRQQRRRDLHSAGSINLFIYGGGLRGAVLRPPVEQAARCQAPQALQRQSRR